jgi:hypothetical protein
MIDLAEFEFWDALQTAGLDKDYGPLIRLLRDNYPLSAEDKSGLADLLEGRIRRPRGRRVWRATDELTRPDEAAVRRAAILVERIKNNDKEEGNPAKGRHERAVRRAFEYMAKKHLRTPNLESLENYLRRSQQPKKRRSTKS